MEQPERLQQEYERRLQDPGEDRRRDDLAGLDTQIRRLRQGVGRLIDSYAEGLIEKGDFEPRVMRLKERITALEGQAQEVAAEATLRAELRLIIGKLEDFTATLHQNLDALEWEPRRALVKRVGIDMDELFMGTVLAACHQ